jgi:hypothetical protein
MNYPEGLFLKDGAVLLHDPNQETISEVFSATEVKAIKLLIKKYN